MSESKARRKQERFAGLVERAAPGTHQAIANYIGGLALPKESTCCDLAAGNGALIARLQGLGFKSITAIEWNTADFVLAGIAPIPLDLNEPFADRIGKPFDLVTAVEIIEHLENPRAFVGEIRRSLRDGGHLVLTTPNLNNWPTRLRYFITGEIRHFLPADIAAQRHITPITEYQMAEILLECGFSLKKTLYCGSFYSPAKNWVMRGIDALLAPVMWQKAPLSEVVIYHAVAEVGKGHGRGRAYFTDPGFSLQDDRL